MKIKDLISKLQKIKKTTSGEVSFKIASPNWAEGDILHELNLVLLENAENKFREIIFEKEQEIILAKSCKRLKLQLF